MDSINSNDFSNLQLDVNALPQIEEVSLHPLSKKYLVKLQISSFVSVCIFTTAIFLAYKFSEPQFHSYLLAAGVVIWVMFGWSFFNNIMYIKRSGYALREKDVIFKRGFLFERITVVPFNRIQHVSVARSFLDKMLHISTVKIFTAGGSGSDLSISGIVPDLATAMKEELSTRISEHV